MENASKALIIAGAILISILIITLGIMIYSNARGVINENAMSELEIQQFNQKFTQYEGSRVRGATVNSMLQTVLANNVSADSDDRKVIVKSSESEGISLGKDDTKITGRAKTGATYEVTCDNAKNGGNKGLVNSITVKEIITTTP